MTQERIQRLGSSQVNPTTNFARSHLIHEVSSPQGRTAGRNVRRRDYILATPDHNIPSNPTPAQCLAVEDNVKEFGLTYFGPADRRQEIVQVIGPGQGFTLLGITCFCGDSHISTHGAFGSLAFGLGTSEVEHNMRITVDGDLTEGVTSKDVILHIIGLIGTAGCTGHVIEYAGSVFRNFSMEARMSVCNMSIEAGARAGMVAPDEVAFEYLLWLPGAEHGNSDDDAKFDVVSIAGSIPDPATMTDPAKRASAERALAYMGLQPNTRVGDIALDKVFIGSCTNSCIDDLRSAARVVLAAGPVAKVSPNVQAMHAEAEGLDAIFKRVGFDRQEAGCSMYLGMNPDQLTPGERCVSTCNRNFEGPYKFFTDPVLPPPKPQPLTHASGTTSVELRGVAAPLHMANVDTDMIILKQFRKTLKRTGLTNALFFALRFDPKTEEKKDFILNRAPYDKAKIPVVSVPNFGCGSSREHAAWSLNDFGIRCIIAPSFGEIFRNNVIQNAMLSLPLSQAEWKDLAVDAEAGVELEVDLGKQEVKRGNGKPAICFTVDPFRRHCLLNALDDITPTLQKQDAIATFEQRRTTVWSYLDGFGYKGKIPVKTDKKTEW
ncbi:hypothetical protein HD554DRAFT_2201949 [Boletus coccyginus]|nr:hypothetical protein HD554DRAFT_2201949 [Boletus coccyginus]